MTTTTTTTASSTAATSTPDTRPRDAPATDIASGAGTQPRESGHVDPAASGSDVAGPAEDRGRAHRLVWLDPHGSRSSACS